MARIAITCRRNLYFATSNRRRQGRMEVKCITGRPFKLFASWDSRRVCFVVKSIDDEHNCTRNMEANRQMTSTWLAKQFLEIFKSRPHWPAKDLIIEKVR